MAAKKTVAKSGKTSAPASTRKTRAAAAKSGAAANADVRSTAAGEEKSFGKRGTAKTVRTKKAATTATAEPSLARRVLRKVRSAADGVASMAGSVIGRG